MSFMQDSLVRITPSRQSVPPYEAWCLGASASAESRFLFFLPQERDNRGGIGCEVGLTLSKVRITSWGWGHSHQEAFDDAIQKIAVVMGEQRK
jgi:hypothetical protein